MGSGREAGVCEEFAGSYGFRSEATGLSSSWFWQLVQSRQCCEEPEEQRNTSPEDRFGSQGRSSRKGTKGNSIFYGSTRSQGRTSHACCEGRSIAATGSSSTTIASTASPASGSDPQDATKSFEKLRGIGIAEGLPAEGSSVCDAFSSEERGSSNHSSFRCSP